ncbi:MAG: hypothetical protein AAFX08_00055 [Pseudomonadota bacterium]
MAKKEKRQDLDDRIGGYFMSAATFAGITGLWAMVVRDDQFYQMTELFGVTLPATTAGYLTSMPIIGYIMGRWPYEATGGRGLGWLGKFGARALNFTYSHLLIVLFTVAMASKAFLNWDLDSAVQAIDDSMFDLASRFAPWLAAYLGGFNLGRANGLSNWRKRSGGVGPGYTASFDSFPDDAPTNHGGNRGLRAEPTLDADGEPFVDDGSSFFPASARKAAARRRNEAGGGASRIALADGDPTAGEGADDNRGFFSRRRNAPDREIIAQMRQRAPKSSAAHPPPSLDRLR